MLTNGQRTGPSLAVAAVFGTGIGLIAALTVRDGRRERAGLPQVITHVPQRFSRSGRVIMFVGGVACFAVAALSWIIEGPSAWEAIMAGIAAGTALLYGGVTARLPGSMIRILGARDHRNPERLPPAG
jgi:hypothetical protein